MRVVVTGATGNIGTSVISVLERDPRVTEVVGVARRRPDSDLGLRKLRWAPADVSRDDLTEAFEGADALIHLAWALNPSRDRELLRTINVGGTKRAFAAALAAGARVVVHASSIGAYSRGPKDRLVDESWPTDGIPGFSYSEDKVAVERHLDELERAHPGVRIVRMRPVLVVKRGAAQHLRRELFGAWVPSFLARPERLPALARHPRLRTQIAHSDDVADAFRLALHADVRGPFNLTSDPVVDGRTVAERTGARTIPVPAMRPMKLAHQLAHLARIVPGEPGWTDELFLSPLVDASRAQRELGWKPRTSSLDALMEVVQGLRDGAGEPTPPLDPSAGGPFRVREVLSAAGTRGPISS